jgi:DNA-binding HxlR family transcriptional regulator
MAMCKSVTIPGMTGHVRRNTHQEGPLRFGALKRQLEGISSKVLTDRLRMLEREGLIFRDHKPTIPPEVTYGLTAHGNELGDALDALEVVARRWQSREG